MWHLMVVCCPQREQIQTALAEAGIGHLVHYPVACHRQRCLCEAGIGPRLPVAERLQHEVLSLPMAPYLSDEEVDSVVGVIRSVLPSVAHAVTTLIPAYKPQVLGGLLTCLRRKRSNLLELFFRMTTPGRFTQALGSGTSQVLGGGS